MNRTVDLDPALALAGNDLGPDRSAPHAVEAEEAVIGCILMDPECYNDVAGILQPTDFYLHKNRWIYDAVRRLNEAGSPLDLITISDELDRHQQLDEAGGVAYLTQCINAVPTSLHVVAYARLIVREAERRRLLEAATIIAKTAYTEGKSIGSMMGAANAALATVYRDTSSHTLSLLEAGNLFLARLKAVMADPEAFMGLMTGLIDLDTLLGGMMPSDFVIVGGRPGAGKTGFMSQVAKYNAALRDRHGDLRRQARRVIQFSLEMENSQLAMRAVAGQTQIEVQKLRLARVAETDLPRIEAAVADFANYQLWYDDTPSLTVALLRAKVREYLRREQAGDPDLIVVDYLQIMSADNAAENRTQEISKISRGLKALAREFNCVVMAGAQLSRGVEHRADNKPVLADLREGGSQEQEADTVILLSKTDQKNIIAAEIAKQRNGATGTVSVYFNSQYTRFENAATGNLNL